MTQILKDAGCDVIATCRKGEPSSALAQVGSTVVPGIDFVDNDVSSKLVKSLKDAGVTKIDTVSLPGPEVDASSLFRTLGSP